MTRLAAMCVILIATLAIVPAFGLDAPKVPASAKRLTGAEIVALYDGNTYAFQTFGKNGVTGVNSYDFKKGVNPGTYVTSNGTKGTFTATIRIKGDQFCYKVGSDKETCIAVYLDGATVYSTDAKGLVTAVAHKQQ